MKGGARTYQGPPCLICGCTEYLARKGCCLSCERERRRLYYLRYSHIAKMDMARRKPITPRQAAMLAGEMHYYPARQCKEHPASLFYVNSGRCLECGRASYTRRRESAMEADRVHSRRYRAMVQKTRPWQKLLDAAKQRSRKRGLGYSLSWAWAEERWTGRCEVSGLEFKSNIGSRVTGRYGHGPLSPSIDRIDQSKGYTPDNCRFVVMGVNAARGCMSDTELYLIVDAIAQRRCAAAPTSPTAPDVFSTPRMWEAA